MLVSFSKDWGAHTSLSTVVAGFQVFLQVCPSVPAMSCRRDLPFEDYHVRYSVIQAKILLHVQKVVDLPCPGTPSWVQMMMIMMKMMMMKMMKTKILRL
jgi:hypothetical protein